MNLRALLRPWLFTFNTIRYRVEWPRIAESWNKVQPFDTLFDGGAGSGEFLSRSMASGVCKRGIALEYDAVNFSRLQDNLGLNPNAQLIRGSLYEVPLPDESVDGVMSTQVIEHLEDDRKAASELCRVLKPGGYALITVPRPPEPWPNDDHVREGYTEEELDSLFAPMGLKPLWHDWFLIRPTTERMLKSSRLPAKGVFMPVASVDAETHLTREARRTMEPFGLLGLYQKER